MGLGLATVLIAASFLGNVEPDASVRAGVRARSMDTVNTASEAADPLPPPGSGASSTRRSGELGIVPLLSLSNDAPLRFALSYSPSVHLSIESDDALAPAGESAQAVRRTTILHDVALRLEREIESWTFRAGGHAAYGEMDPIYDALSRADTGPSTPGAVRPLATTSRLPYQEYGASAGLSWAATSTTLLSFDGGFGLGGGIGEDAVAVIPAHREIQANLRLEHEASARSRYGAVLAVTDTRVVDLSDSTVARGGGSWTYALGRPSTLRLTGGIAAATEKSTSPLAPEVERRPVSSLVPWAEGSLVYDVGERHPVLSVTMGGEPAVDRLHGALDYRLTLAVASTWTLLEVWRFGVSGSVAALEPWLGYEGEQVARTWVGTTEARIDHVLTRHLLIGGALSATLQKSGRPELPSFRELSVLAEVTAVWDGGPR